MTDIGITSFDHLIIAVRDLDVAEADYTRILGRAPSWRGAHPQAGTANVLYRLGNMYLELLAPVGEGFFATGVTQHLDRSGEGIFGIVLGVENADAAAVGLRERGYRPSEPQPGSGVDERTGAVRAWRNVYLAPDETRGLFMFLIEHQSPADALPVAALTDEASEFAAVDSLDHVVVMTPDPEACKALFGDVLGIRLALDHSKPEWGVRQLFFRTGGVTIEVVASLNPEKQPETDHYWGVAWKTRDIVGAGERLRAAGTHVSDVRVGRKKGTLVSTLKSQTHGVPTLLIEQQ